MDIKVGNTFTQTRTFTTEDILQFAEISGDKGRHHIEPDADGRLMVHGLLTASIGTKIGGDMNYIARELNSEFIRPVFSGDTIVCEVIITEVIQMDGFRKVSLTSTYRNQVGKEVLIGTSHGIIRDK